MGLFEFLGWKDNKLQWNDIGTLTMATPIKTSEIVLHHLSKRKVKRKELTLLTGLTDRGMRLAIHELRMKGHRIVTDTKEGGYWLGTNDEWNNFCEVQRRRAINNFYRKTTEIDGQITIEFKKEEEPVVELSDNQDFNVGDMVTFNYIPETPRPYYPPFGTSGQVISNDNRGIIVKWQDKTTEGDGEWFVHRDFIKLTHKKEV